jgi:poly(A) polymerase
VESRGLQAAAAVIQRLRAAGHAAYLVGGCVRDLLLGRVPKDFDVATSARPDAVMALFGRAFGVGAHFGVVLVPVEVDGAEIVTEVATFRSDGAYSDGRRPDQVQYTDSPEHDVERRDFTINGMLLDIDRYLAGDSAEDAVLDYVGGRADLAAGLVRAIGEPMRRFKEDKLRMLRAVRFAARFGFAIERETFAAIQAMAREIGQVSRERTRDELTRMLTEGRAADAFKMLDASGLLQQVLPEVAAMRGVEQPPEWHPEGDVWVHTLLLLEKLPAGCSPTLAWGALLHDVGKPPTFVRADRIRFNGHA